MTIDKNTLRKFRVDFKTQMAELENAVDISKNDTKWNIDLVSQKDSQIKILKEKIKMASQPLFWLGAHLLF